MAGLYAGWWSGVKRTGADEGMSGRSKRFGVRATPIRNGHLSRAAYTGSRTSGAVEQWMPPPPW
jgi:hypothetical protein